MITETICEKCPVEYEWRASGKKGICPCNHDCDLMDAINNTQKAYDSLFKRYKRQIYELGEAENIINDFLETLDDIDIKIQQIKNNIEFYKKITK